MALSCFSQAGKQVKLSDGTSYAYLYLPAAPSKPTLLLLHGFPSAAYEWRNQIELSRNGFGLVIPDLLGYGDTDAPSDIEAYSLKTMSRHISEILEKEEIEQVIGVSHDWGCGLLSHLHFWYPEKLKAVAFLSVGYTEISENPWDLDGLNAMMEKAFGYATFGYWYLFERDDAGKILDGNAECAEALIYPADFEDWKNYLAPKGGFERWIDLKKNPGLPQWLTSAEMAEHNRILAKKGYGPATNWYKAGLRGVDLPKVAGIPLDRNRVNLPSLLIVGSKDCVTRAEVAKQGTAKWVENLRVEELDCGHWIQLEKSKELNSILLSFVNGVTQ